MWLLNSVKSSLKDIWSNISKSKQEKIKKAFINISDPFAKKISWERLNIWWTNFITNILTKNTNWNLELKSSFQTKIFLIVFSLIPFILFLTLFLNYFTKETNLNTIVALFVFTLFYFWTNFFIFNNFSKPIVFDKKIGYFYKWKLNLNLEMIDIDDKNITSLNNIYAVQLLSEFVYWNMGSYYSYELNLVLKDKSRINLIDHWNLNIIKSNAKTIWNYLWVPVWDWTTI